jgi:hypothetical protein
MNTLSLNLATPEQQIAIDKALSLLAGVKTVTPLFYQGVIIGSEFATYSAKKLYVALSLNVSSDNTLGANPCGLELFDKANVLNAGYNNCNVDALANYHFNDINIDNVIFSRLLSDDGFGAPAYLQMRFVGYKITIP